MKTKNINETTEKSKVQLFNLLYLDYKNYLNVYNDDGSYNGITLKEHFKNNPKLIELLENKPTIYANIRRVSPNGLVRDISFYSISNDNAWNKLNNITYLMSYILDEREPKQDKFGRNILRVNGTGMDMVFHTVYSLGNVLFRDIEQDIDKSGYLLRYYTI